MIIDTNALSAWRDGDRDLLLAMAASPTLVLPVIAVGEFRYGVSRSRERLQAGVWLDRVIAATRLVAIGLDTANRYAAIRSSLQMKGRPIPANDLWMAALAIEHGLPILSRDQHFDVVDGLTRVGW